MKLNINIFIFTNNKILHKNRNTKKFNSGKDGSSSR